MQNYSCARRILNETLLYLYCTARFIFLTTDSGHCSKNSSKLSRFSSVSMWFQLWQFGGLFISYDGFRGAQTIGSQHMHTAIYKPGPRLINDTKFFTNHRPKYSEAVSR